MSETTMKTTEESTQELLGDIDKLAADRPVALRIIAMCDNDNSSAQDVGNALMMDATITARVLRLANSAYYGLNSQVTTTSFAIAMLGFSTVRALAAVVLSGMDADEVPEEFRVRSRLVASGTKAVSRQMGLKGPEMFCLGLVSMLGQPLLYQHDNSYLELLHDKENSEDRISQLTAERDRYGMHHSELGGLALERWLFPPIMTEAVKNMDSPFSTTHTASLALRAGVEISRRIEGKNAQDISVLTQGNLNEMMIKPMLDAVHKEAQESW